MKILFLAPQIFKGRGGIMQFNKDIIEALSDTNSNVVVISINDDKDRSNKNIRFISSAKPAILKKIIFLTHIIRQIFIFRPDIIICAHINFAPICRLLKNIFGIRYYVITYGIDIFNMSGQKALGLIKADKIIAISRFTKDKILENISVLDRSKIFILPCTVKGDIFKPEPKPDYLRKRFNVSSNDKIILTVARLSGSEKYKGYDKVIEALKFVRKEIPDIKYFLIGSGDDLRRVKGVINENGLEENVILPGSVSDEEIVDYYNLCDIFIMPSKAEGFGIVFLEALACGKTVISGNRDGSRDPLLDGKLGLLIDPDDINKIGETILMSLTQKIDSRLVDREYLRRSVLEEYGFDRFKEKVEEIFAK